MEDLPPPVQRFLKSRERDEVSLRLSRKYKLHADDAGSFERAYIFMLLGVFTPQEFMQELRESGLDDTTVRGLATDVNEQVFKKLRTQERDQSAISLGYRNDPIAPVVSVMQTAHPRMQTDTSYGSAITTTSAPQAPTPAAYAPIYMSPPAQATTRKDPAAPVPVPSPSIPLPAPQIPAPVPATTHPHARTMASDMELAAHGFAGVQPAGPTSPFRAAPTPISASYPSAMASTTAVFAPSPTITPAFATTAPAAAPIPPVASIPSVLSAPAAQPPAASAFMAPPATVQQASSSSQPYTVPQPFVPASPTPSIPSMTAPPVTAPIRLTPIDRSHDGEPIRKEFGSDPYREPIE